VHGHVVRTAKQLAHDAFGLRPRHMAMYDDQERYFAGSIGLSEKSD
jgi:hypothetical protein